MRIVSGMSASAARITTTTTAQQRQQQQPPHRLNSSSRKGFNVRRRAGVVRGVVITRAAVFRNRSNGHSNSSPSSQDKLVTVVRDSNGDTVITKFTPPKRDLGLGDIGSDVENLQRAIGMKTLDGVYGEDTVSAVKAWQEANRIEATGFFGPKSRSVIRKNRAVMSPNAAANNNAAAAAAASTADANATAGNRHQKQQQPALPTPPAASKSYGTRKIVSQPSTPPPSNSAVVSGPGPVVNVAGALIIGGEEEEERHPRGEKGDI